MSWKDELQKGKFREAEFFTESVGNSIGRRSVLHEYPGRDTPYSEDMGKQAREFTIDCLVVGDEYMAARDSLIKELEKPGTGKLIHPYWGEQTVQVVNVRVRESSEEGRIARFSISFTEAGKNDSPIQDRDTASLITQNVNSGILANNNDFASVFNVVGFPDFVRVDAISMVNSSLDLIEAGAAAIDAVTDIRDNVDTLINDPLQLATEISSAMGQTAGIDALRGVHAYGDDLDTLAQTSASRVAEASNRTSIIAMVRTAAVLETARLLV